MTKKIQVIFDLDGVVIDSAHIIQTAYTRAGVNPPKNILAQEDSNWLAEQCGEENIAAIKMKKASIYHELISSGQASLLSGYFAASRAWFENYHTVLLTAAPVGTVDVMKTWLGDDRWVFNEAYDNMKKIDKAIFMRRRAVQGVRGIYFDDQDRRDETPISWKFIRYNGQRVEVILSEIAKL